VSRGLVAATLCTYSVLPTYCQGVGRTRPTPDTLSLRFRRLPAQRPDTNAREQHICAMNASTDQKVGGSSPSERATLINELLSDERWIVIRLMPSPRHQISVGLGVDPCPAPGDSESGHVTYTGSDTPGPE
jgi:hypothetical protein